MVRRFSMPPYLMRVLVAASLSITVNVVGINAFTLKTNDVCSGSKVGDRWILTGKHCKLSFLDEIEVGGSNLKVCSPPVSFGKHVDVVLLEVWVEGAEDEWDEISEIGIGTLPKHWGEGFVYGLVYGSAYISKVGVREVNIKKCKEAYQEASEQFPTLGFCGEAKSSVAPIDFGMSGGPLLVNDVQVGVTVTNAPIPAFVDLSSLENSIKRRMASPNKCVNAYREDRYILAGPAFR